MKYFKESEFVMGSENVFNKMDEEFLELLDNLRTLVGSPLSLNSSYRSEEYNKSIGGSKNSQHMKGIASDLHCTDSNLRLRIVENALGLGLTCGIAKTFIHIDNRLKQIVFAY
jgi:uncharacterized protein YcbK (DUF882 family)